MSNEQTRKRRGCFFYGCLTGGVLFVLVAGLIFMAFRGFTKRLVALTDDKPRELPAVELPADEMKELQQRVAQFSEAFKTQKESQTLVLSARDINALFQNDTNFSRLRDKVFVTIESNKFKADMSIPLDELKWKRVRGKYLNGSATFEVGLQEGDLKIFIKDMEIKGEPLDEKTMKELVEQNLAQEFHRRPESSEAIKRLESVEVKGDQIEIKTKAATESPTKEESTVK